MSEHNDAVFRSSCIAASSLLTSLCAMTASSGVSQQHFEWVHLPHEYAALLIAQGTWLRALIAVDHLFIASYVLATIALAQRVAGARCAPLSVAIAAAVRGKRLPTLVRSADTSLATRPSRFRSRAVR